MACGAVLFTPGRAARGLAEWAVDLWPYVNGKALTLGLRLEEMELSDMLDVVHFFLEEDLRYRSPEEYESVNSVRSRIYETFYNSSYVYKGESLAQKKNSNGRQYVSKTADFDDLPSEFSDTRETKPFIPPTPVNADSHMPFGNVLDSPLG